MEQRTVPLKYEGLWRRKAIHRSNGTSDLTTAVWWFQGASFHIDLRVPVNARPQDKNGFAGVTVMAETAEGERCEWQPEIAFPFRSEEIDAGYMYFDSEDTLREVGVDGSYSEDWYREPNGETESSREVEADGTISYCVEGTNWRATARGRPTDTFHGNENNKNSWTDISVYRREHSGEDWTVVASTTE
jgi:hypothetical protein